MDQAVRFVPVFLFPSDVLGAASADTRCARHLRPFCFALLFSCIEESAPRSGFGTTTKFKGLRLSQTQRKTLRFPQKARSQAWEQPTSRFCAQAQQGRKKEITQ
jgi:hypothetical protein